MLTLPSKTPISASQARILTHYQLLLKELLPTVWTREKYGVSKTIGKKKGNFIGYWSITSAPCFFWTGLGFFLSLKTRENWTLQAPYMSLALRNSKQKPCQVSNFDFVCKHKKPLLSVWATGQWMVQNINFATWKIHHVWSREKVLFLGTSWLTWACTRASLKRMNQFTENLPACCRDNPRLLLSQIKRRSGFRKESYR